MPTSTSGRDNGDEEAILSLYRRLLGGWNTHNAEQFATSFASDGEVIGFDGSEMHGQAEIQATLQGIFAEHVTASYVSKVRWVHFVSPTVAVLHAIVGMAPPGKHELNPAVNAHQTLIATKSEGSWHIVLFQNTPAQFHGRPELVAQMTDELSQELER